MNKIKKRPWALLFLTGLVIRLIFSVQIYSGDVNNHVAWGKDILAFGPQGVYERSFEKYGVMTPTYPPIPLFLFTFFYWLFDAVYKIAWNLNLSIKAFPSGLIWFLQDQDTLPAFLKIPSILSDLGIAWLVYLFGGKLLGKKASLWPKILAGLVLFNPAFFYNSAFWGQIEAIPIFFLLASFYWLFFRKKEFLPVVFFSLALLTKQTAIIFVPLFALGYWQKFGLKKAFSGLLVFLLFFYLLFLPFFKQGNLLSFPFSTYWEKIQSGSGSDYVTDHAFNFWVLISGLGKISDAKPFWLGIPFRAWGYLFFLIAMITIFGRLCFKKGKPKDFLFAAGLIPFAAFLFLTRMHERYLQPVLPFLLLLVPKNKIYSFSFFFVSCFYLFNLYHNWWFGGNFFTKSLFSQTPVINFLIGAAIGVFGVLGLKYWQGEKKSEKFS